MARLSKVNLSKQIERQIFENFWEAISQIRDKKDIQSFLNDLLTPTERVMRKEASHCRYAPKGQDYATIRHFLKVSNETIAKVGVVLKTNQGYKTVIDKIIRTKAGRQFWKEVESFLYRFSSASRIFLPEDDLRKLLKT